MSEESLLIRTPSPRPTESFFGFILRVSEVNGYEDPNYILMAAQVPRGLEWKAGCPVEGLESILGGHGHGLRRIAYRDSDSAPYRFKILEHQIGGTLRGILRLANPAFCVRCVQEKGHLDAFWDLSAAVACPVHNCRPTTHCRSCGKPVSWRRRNLLTCACGADFPPEEPMPRDESLAELMHLITGLLHGQAEMLTSRGLPIGELRSMPLASLLQMVSFLGAFAVNRSDYRAPPDTESIRGAARVLSDWPRGFHEHLREVSARSRVSRRSAGGFRRHFEAFHGPMFEHSPEMSRDLEWMRAEFVRFGVTMWGEGAVRTRMRGADVLKHEVRYVTKHVYAKRHRLSKPVLDRMIADGTIATKTVTTANGTKVVIDLEASTPPADSTETISDREAGRMSGLPVRVIEELRSRGVIRSKPRRGHLLAWYREDVEDFLKRCATLNAETPFDGAVVSVAKLMQLKLRSAAAKTDIVQAIMAGQIPVVGREGDSIGSLLVDENRAKAFIADKRTEVEGGTYSLPEAAQKTGVDVAVVPAAISAGLFDAVESNGRVRITIDSANRFCARYEVLARVASRLKTSVSRLLRLCDEADVVVTSLARPESGSPQPLIERHSLQKPTDLLESHRREEYAKTKAHATQTYLAALDNYWLALRARGEHLPRSRGAPAKATIGRACNFGRQVFDNNAAVAARLAELDQVERLDLPLGAQMPTG